MFITKTIKQLMFSYCLDNSALVFKTLAYVIKREASANSDEEGKVNPSNKGSLLIQYVTNFLQVISHSHKVIL